MWHYQDKALKDIVILDPVKFLIKPATYVICQYGKEGDTLLEDFSRNAHSSSVIFEGTSESFGSPDMNEHEIVYESPHFYILHAFILLQKCLCKNVFGFYCKISIPAPQPTQL